MSLPENYSYSDDHEWIDTTADKAVGAKVKVGITSVATDRLGEIVFADLPQGGDSVEAKPAVRWNPPSSCPTCIPRSRARSLR